jgi:hypothetical protein
VGYHRHRHAELLLVSLSEDRAKVEYLRCVADPRRLLHGTLQGSIINSIGTHDAADDVAKLGGYDWKFVDGQSTDEETEAHGVAREKPCLRWENNVNKGREQENWR